MKKALISFLAAGIIISAGAGTVLAAGGNSSPAPARSSRICNYVEGTAASGTCTNYIDADNDGICDNYTDSGSRNGTCIENGTCIRNGICYNDSDNDGMCDNYTDRDRPQNGTGNQCRNRHGRNR